MVDPHAAPRVGTDLIEGFVRSELGGRADLSYPRAGASHEFTIMLDDASGHYRADRGGGPTTVTS